MALELPFGVRVLNQKPVDEKYLNDGVPYFTVAQANSLIEIGIRHTGLTVNVLGVEYWYKEGIQDADLVEKNLGGTASGERIEKVIEQNNDFEQCEVIGYSGGTYVRAIAHKDFDGEIHGIVTKTGTTEFTLTYSGYITGLVDTVIPLTENTTYFASDTTPGLITDQSPTQEGAIKKPMFATTAQNAALVFQYLGVAIATGVTGGASGVTDGYNVGGGEEVFKEVSGETVMVFRTLYGTGGTEVQQVGDAIYISGVTKNKDVTNDNSPTYNATNDDQFIGASGTTSVILPSDPETGKEIIIADIEGDAGTNPVTVYTGDPTHKILDGDTAIINTDYGSISFIWNGILWSISAYVN